MNVLKNQTLSIPFNETNSVSECIPVRIWSFKIILPHTVFSFALVCVSACDGRALVVADRCGGGGVHVQPPYEALAAPPPSTRQGGY